MTADALQKQKNRASRGSFRLSVYICNNYEKSPVIPFVCLMAKCVQPPPRRIPELMLGQHCPARLRSITRQSARQRATAGHRSRRFASHQPHLFLQRKKAASGFLPATSSGVLRESPPVPPHSITVAPANGAGHRAS